MKRSNALFFLCLLALAVFVIPHSADAASQCDAARALREMRAATGGNNWNGIAQIEGDGRATISGLRGSARFDDDLVKGRYARRFRIAVMGSSAEVYDGSTVWVQDMSGGVHPHDSPYSRAQAVTNAYLTRRGYFEPQSSVAVTCVGTQTANGQSQIVIRVQPRGGSVAELAIDMKTHLLASSAQREPLDRFIVKYSDYRAVDGLVLPFSITSGTAQDPGDDYAFSAIRYALLRSARAADFAKPVAREALRMLHGATSTTVPMMLEGRQLMVWASINGRPPMPFILDTGGEAILDTVAAKALGLTGQGAGESGGSGAGTISIAFTRVRSIRIGDAELLDQPVIVVPYPYSFSERGRRTPLAGILGIEFFERFAARLDYGDRTVTLTPLSSFRSARGTPVPFTFESDPNVPMVNAAADEIPGLFGVDTGNSNVLHLYGTFLKRTGLDARYPGGTPLIGHGTGGTNTGRQVKLRSFTIGGHVLDDVQTDLTNMTSGAFSAWTQAGNVGFTILSRFIPTFDYARQIMYLAPEHRATPIPPNRSGLAFEKKDAAAFDVMQVTPRSAASSAAIVAGDSIVAVDGKPADDVSRADLLGIVTQSAGTVVRLRIVHAGITRDVTLRLRSSP